MSKYVPRNFIVDSSAAFLKNVSFDSSVYLKGKIFLSTPIESFSSVVNSLVVESIGPNVQIKFHQLGSMSMQDASTWRLWEMAQDASITRLDSSLAFYVKKEGDIMTGSLILDGNNTNFEVDGSSIFNGKAVFKNTVFFEGSTYYTSVETIDISSAYIYLNSGFTGEPPANLQSGIIIGRGSQNPYVIIYDETSQTFRIGVSYLDTSSHYSDSSTQIIATREDTPTSNGVALWNNTLKRFDTSSALSFTNNILNLDGSLSINKGLTISGLSISSSENTSLMILPNGVVVTRDILITDVSSISSSGYDVYSQNVNGIAYIKQIIPGNGLNIISDISSLTIYTNETSIMSYIDGSLYVRDTSLGNLSHWDITQDLSLNFLRTYIDGSLSFRDASISKLFEYDIIQDTSLSYIRTYVDGSLSTRDTSLGNLSHWEITQDLSLNFLRTYVDGSLNSKSGKYIGTFDGSANSTFNILSSTHKLGNGPFNISVYDQNHLVYIDVECYDNGDVSLYWTLSPMSSSCKFIITG